MKGQAMIIQEFAAKKTYAQPPTWSVHASLRMPPGQGRIAFRALCQAGHHCSFMFAATYSEFLPAGTHAAQPSDSHRMRQPDLQSQQQSTVTNAPPRTPSVRAGGPNAGRSGANHWRGVPRKLCIRAYGARSPEKLKSVPSSSVALPLIHDVVCTPNRSGVRKRSWSQD